MGGAKVTRLNPASQPGLTQPGLDLLYSIFGGGGGQGNFGSKAGAGLFQQMGGTTGAQRNPLAEGGNISERLNSIFGNPGGASADALMALGGGHNPGQDVLNAAQPVFQRNLGLAQEQGARFSSGNELLRTQALNDFNLFGANVLQQGLDQQMRALLGAGDLRLQGQMPLIQQLLGALFQGGGVNSGPIYDVQPGLGQQLLSLGGSVAGGLLGGRGGGGGSAPAQFSGDPYNPFGQG